MKEISLASVHETDLPILETWHKGGKDNFFQKPTKKWIEYISQNKDTVFVKKMLLNGGEIIGVFQIDIENEIGYVGIIISPKFRGKGFGKKLLEILESRIMGKAKKLQAFIDEKNIISTRLFVSAGYNFVGKDSHNLTIYEKNIIYPTNFSYPS